jgi:uridine phosphorylase
VADSATVPEHAIHLHPTAPLAERVLLPGDPGRALALAQTLLAAPKMFNHNRGLWGYTGEAADGRALTIQATGMGGPSAAIVFEELTALDRSLQLGELVIAREAICADGTSRALGGGERTSADPKLSDALARAAPSARDGTIVSVDLFYERDGSRSAAHAALAVEMEAATLFAIGAHAQIPVACLLCISDTFGAGERHRIDSAALHSAAERMGEAALAALAA